jgi:hypothetical protein
MVTMVPVDPQRHAGKAWRPQAGYAFAMAQALVPLAAVEFGKAAVAMPIAFLESSGRYIPVGVTSPVEGRNMYVTPTGKWLGSYVPASLRAYPFRLGMTDSSTGANLLVDEDSGWVIDADESATRFFEEDGSPSAALKRVAQLLLELEQARSLTHLAVGALAEAGLIRPWALDATLGNQHVTVEGLHRVDETALDGLDEKAFVNLRKTSSLAVAYAQMISMHNVDLLRTLAAEQQQLSLQASPQADSIAPFTIDFDETIKF